MRSVPGPRCIESSRCAVSRTVYAALSVSRPTVCLGWTSAGPLSGSNARERTLPPRPLPTQCGHPQCPLDVGAIRPSRCDQVEVSARLQGDPRALRSARRVWQRRAWPPEHAGRRRGNLAEGAGECRRAGEAGLRRDPGWCIAAGKLLDRPHDPRPLTPRLERQPRLGREQSVTVRTDVAARDASSLTFIRLRWSAKARSATRRPSARGQRKEGRCVRHRGEFVEHQARDEVRLVGGGVDADRLVKQGPQQGRDRDAKARSSEGRMPMPPPPPVANAPSRARRRS